MMKQTGPAVNFDMISGCFISFLVIFFAILIWRRRKLYWLSWQMSGPLALPFIGNAITFLLAGTTDFLDLIPWCVEHYGKSKLTRVWMGGDLNILVTDATAAGQINKLNLVKGAAEHIAQPLLRLGLFTDRNIPHWKASRKIVAQIFHFKVIKNFVPIFHDETLTLMGKLQRFAENGNSFYPPDLVELLTFNTILRTSLGLNLHVQRQDNHPVMEAMHKLFEHFQWKATVPMLRNNFLYTLIGRRHSELRSMETLDAFAQTILKEIRHRPGDSMPLSGEPLSVLLAQHPEISEEEIKAQIITIFVAGTDTSMFTNSIMLFVLAAMPDIQSQIYNELVETLESDCLSCPSYEDLLKLNLTDRFIKEVLRMFPAGYYVAKESTQEMRITTDDNKEHVFPPGVHFTILVSLIHRSPDYYKDPLIFNPDRWLPEQVATRHPSCYLPFSSGPRNCIAGKYALLQMKTFLATLLRRYEVLPSDSFKTLVDLKLKIRLTMSIQKQCRIRLRLRTPR